MAVTINFFDNTRKQFANGEVRLADLKVMLVNNNTAAVFNKAYNNISQIVANEVSGNNFAVGGQAVGSAAIAVTGTNNAVLTGNNISQTASGGPIGPTLGAVLYQCNASTAHPYLQIDFGGSQSAGDGTAFKINWNASGIIQWTT